VYRHKLDRTSPFILNPADPFASVPESVEDTTFTAWQLGWTGPGIEFWNSRLSFGVDGRLEEGKSDSELVGVFPIGYRIDRSYGGGFAEWLVELGRTVIEVDARVDVIEGYDTELNPRVGFFYLLPGDRTRLRASAGRAFKLPSFFALSVPVFGNPDLRPETVVGVDTGVDLTFASAGLTTTLRLFYNQFEDLVTFDGATSTHVNVPEVDSQGAELAIDWTATGNIVVHANVTYQDFDTPGSTSALTHRPEWFGAASFVWRIQDRTRWVLDGQYVSEAFDFQLPLIDPPNSFGTELTSGYQVFGTALTVDVAKHWEVHARIDNLTDEEYQPFIGFPGPDRSFRVGLRYQSH
jgi:outer membrane receptor protein involved in Fe transport